MLKTLKGKKIKNKKQLEQYLLSSLKEKRVDATNSSFIQFITNYLEQLNNFYQQPANKKNQLKHFYLKLYLKINIYIIKRNAMLFYEKMLPLNWKQ